MTTHRALHTLVMTGPLFQGVVRFFLQKWSGPGLVQGLEARGGLRPRHYRHVPRAPTYRGPPSDQKNENPIITAKEKVLKMTGMGAS